MESVDLSNRPDELRGLGLQPEALSGLRAGIRPAVGPAGFGGGHLCAAQRQECRQSGDQLSGTQAGHGRNEAQAPHHSCPTGARSGFGEGTKSPAVTIPPVACWMSATLSQSGRRAPDTQLCTVETGRRSRAASSTSVKPREALKSDNVMRTFYAESGFPCKEDFHRQGLGRRHAAPENPQMAKPPTGLSPEARTMQGNLKLWRKARKLTLAALAEQTGNKVSTLSSWENGDRAVDLDDLRRLASFYEVHPAALLMRPEDAGPKITAMQRAATMIQSMNPGDADAWLEIGRRLGGNDKQD